MTLATLQPLQKKLLSENVVGAIRTAILNRDLEMGQRLVETELAEQLRVSRGPIREALRLLVAEGLVIINAHRGTFVLRPTEVDVEEIYSLRETLEVLAIRRLVRLASDEEVDSLRAIGERFNAVAPGKNVNSLVELDMEFHTRLFHLARHQRVLRNWSALQSQVRLCIAASMDQHEKRPISFLGQDHAVIVQAVRDRDAETAARLLARHIQKGAEFVQKAMQSASKS